MKKTLCALLVGLTDFSCATFPVGKSAVKQGLWTVNCETTAEWFGPKCVKATVTVTFLLLTELAFKSEKCAGGKPS
jgi:hypothetical protein